MTNEQLVAKFNPANAKNLTPEDFQIMRELTDAQLDTLAEAYPNTPSRRSYLRLYDTKIEANKQIYNLSTWQNLRNVRKFSNMKNLQAYDFFDPQMKIVKAPEGITSAKASPRKQVVDLSATEAAAELAKSIAKKTAAEKPASEKTSAKKAEKEQAPKPGKAVTVKDNKAVSAKAPKATAEAMVTGDQAPGSDSTDFPPVV